MKRAPIQTEEQYSKALSQAYQMMQTELEVGTSQGDDFEDLCSTIKQYELVHYPLQEPVHLRELPNS